MYESRDDNPQCIKVIDIKTKQIYNSIAEAVELLQIRASTLSEYLRCEVYNKTNIMYLSEYTEEALVVPQPKENKRQVKLICINTCVIYDSIRKGADSIGVPFNTLRQYLKGNYPNKTSLVYLSDYLLENPDFKVD